LFQYSLKAAKKFSLRLCFEPKRVEERVISNYLTKSVLVKETKNQITGRLLNNFI